MKVVKTIITVFVAIMSLLVCLLAVSLFFSEADYLKYEAGAHIESMITATEIEYLGNEYNGKSEDGFSYYRLYVTIENNSNYNYNTNNIYLYYDSADYEGNDWEYYSIIPVENTYQGMSESNCIPAGKVATCSEVLCIEDDCKGFMIIYNNYTTDTKQTIEIEL